MIVIEGDELKRIRTLLDAHRYTLADGYSADTLRELSMLLDQMYIELLSKGYVFIKEKGGLNEHRKKTKFNPAGRL